MLPGDTPLPGQAVPIRPNSPPPVMVAWWKEQLEAVNPPHNKAGGSRHRRRHDDDDSDDSDVSMRSGKSLHDEADELREALRAARRQLDAGERRERALRRAVRRQDEPSIEGEPRRRAPQVPIGQGGMLDQVLLQSGLLATEEGRLQLAQLLAKATGTNVEPPGSRAPLPPAPAMIASADARMGMASMTMPPDARSNAPAFAPGGGVAFHLPGFEPPPVDISAGFVGQPSSAPHPAALHGAPMMPAGMAPPPPPPPPPPRLPVADDEISGAADALLELVVADEVRSVVKSGVRAMVQSLLPSKKAAHKNKVDSGPYGLLYSALLTDVLLSEASGVVGRAIETVAADYVLVRGAERVFHSIIEDILRTRLPISHQISPDLARSHQISPDRLKFPAFMAPIPLTFSDGAGDP